MLYLKINALLLELWDEYRPESVPNLLKENSLQGEWSLLKFEQLTSEDKIRALDMRLKETERQLNMWRAFAIKSRERPRKEPILRDYGTFVKLVPQF
jgi:hypothetical protein